LKTVCGGYPIGQRVCLSTVSPVLANLMGIVNDWGNN